MNRNLLWDWIWLDLFRRFLVFSPSFFLCFCFYIPFSSRLLYCSSALPLVRLPLFLSLPLNYGSGGADTYVRAEAASAKQLSNALGRRLPMAGQVQEKPFYLLNVRLLDFGIMPKMPRKKGHEIRREKGGKNPPTEWLSGKTTVKIDVAPTEIYLKLSTDGQY